MSVDCYWPPMINVDAEKAYDEFTNGAQTLGILVLRCPHKTIINHFTFYLPNAFHLGTKANLFEGVHKWSKDGHVGRMIESGMFNYCREIVVHNQDKGISIFTCTHVRVLRVVCFVQTTRCTFIN